MTHLYHPKHWASWFGVLVILILSKLPVFVRQAVASGFAAIAWKVNHKRRSIVLTNLQICFAEKTDEQREALGRLHFNRMALGLLDLGQIWFASKRSMVKQANVTGWVHVEAAKNDGKNIIFHVAHSPAVDFGVVLSLRGEMLAPYKKAKNEVVDTMVQYGRKRFGGKVFERSDGMLAYTRALKRGSMLYILGDEDHGPEHSIMAPFFSHPKATLPVTGRLSKVANAVVLPLMVWYNAETGKYEVTIHPVIEGVPSKDPQTDVILINEALERLIRTSPADYMWTLKLFKTQQDGRDIYHASRRGHGSEAP